MTTRRDKGDGSVFQRADGKWVAMLDLGLVNGKRRRATRVTKTKREAQQKLAELKRLHGQGVDLTVERQTVNQYLDHWLSGIKQDCKPKTHAIYEMMVRCYITPHIGHIRLLELTVQHVERMKTALQSRDNPLTSTTIRKAIHILRQALKKAEKQGLIPRNVVALVDAPPVAAVKHTPLTFDQAMHFLHVVEDDPYARQRAALYHLAIYRGLRQGELLALTWDDIDFTAQTLRVQEGKTDASARTIPLDDELVAVLRQRRRLQREERVLAEKWADTNLVFTTSTGGYIPRSAIYRQFQRLLQAAGLPQMSFHELRHTCTTLLIQTKADPARVRAILGHKNISTTLQYYTHLTIADQRETHPAFRQHFKRTE
jgi:integrase